MYLLGIRVVRPAGVRRQDRTGWGFLFMVPCSAQTTYIPLDCFTYISISRRVTIGFSFLSLSICFRSRGVLGSFVRGSSSHRLPCATTHHDVYFPSLSPCLQMKKQPTRLSLSPPRPTWKAPKIKPTNKPRPRQPFPQFSSGFVSLSYLSLPPGTISRPAFLPLYELCSSSTCKPRE